MKNLQKLAVLSILMIVIFMVVTLVQFPEDNDGSMLPDRFAYLISEDWTMASLHLKQQRVSEAELEQPERILELYDAAREQGICSKTTLPYRGRGSDDSVIIFENIIPEEYAGMTLNFATADAGVHVVFEGEMIYHSEADRDMEPEQPSGRYENFVDIPQISGEAQMLIVLLPRQTDTAELLGEVRVESQNLVVVGVVGNSVADIGCCILIMITSVVLFMIALVRRYTGQPSRGEVYLGLGGLAAGIYCFIGTDTLSIFYNLHEAYKMQEYLVLLLPVFLTMYFERNLRTLYPFRFSALLCLVSLHAVGQILLHLSGIKSLLEMVNISAVVIGLVCVVAIVSLVQYDYKNKSYQTVLSVLSMLLLLSGGIANVILNTILDRGHINTAGQYSMTIAGILMSVMHVFRLSMEYREDAEKRVEETERQNIRLAQAKQEAETARHEAQSANEAKGKFLAHMSHEIRTPINAVLGMDEMILRESKEQNIREYAMDIFTAGQTLLSLINDILDFSRIESGKMEIVPVVYDMSSLLHDLVNMTAQRASAKNLRLEVEAAYDLPSRLYGDDVRIRQILANLLTNAVKYTQEGTVWLRVKRLPDGQTDGACAAILFEVEDTGIGIKEADLPKLTAEFERIEEDRNRNIEGTGLGMSITLQLLSLLGSGLKAESTYGKGSRFSFVLRQKVIDQTPVGDFKTRVRQIAENNTYKAKVYAPDASILVVDDNAVNRKVLRNLLKETKIQVSEAGGGAECLRLVQEHHYDLIFLDHMMPEMDGVETLHEIRGLSDFPCRDTPVVVLTANAVAGAKEQYLSEGFDNFLSKPVVPQKLEQMIRNMLPPELLKEAPAVKQTDAAEVPPAEQDYFVETSQVPVDGPEAWEEFPQVDGLDWQYAWMHLPDRKLLEDTVREFYDQIGSSADRLQQFFIQIGQQTSAAQKLDDYRIQAHAMKSLAAMIGILPLSGVAKMLEHAAKDGDISVIVSITPAFLAEWRSYREKLQGVCGIDDKALKPEADISVSRALVEMVCLSMQEMDIDQADERISQLRDYAYPSEIAQNIQKLAEAVTDLDVEKAGQIAEQLFIQMEEQMKGSA